MAKLKLYLGDEPAYDTRFIGFDDLRGKEYTVEITGARLERLKKPGTMKETKKPILALKGWAKEWAVCQEAAADIVKTLGTNQISEWVGKRIVIWPDPDVKFGRDRVGGVRLRLGAKPAPTPQPQPDSATSTAAASGKDEL